jgi:hypothetical protein
MTTIAPCGQTWQMYCGSSPVEIDKGTGLLKGAWAQSGPAGQAAQAAMAAGPQSDKEFIEQACDNLEKACEAATAMGRALPIINQVIHRG